MLMPGFNEAQAVARAEMIQQRVTGLDLIYNGRSLGPVTVSIGLAVYPTHGPASSLISTADAALLRAKDAGRDRIVIANRRREPDLDAPDFKTPDFRTPDFKTHAAE